VFDNKVRPNLMPSHTCTDRIVILKLVLKTELVIINLGNQKSLLHGWSDRSL